MAKESKTTKRKAARKKHPARPEFHDMELEALAVLCGAWAAGLRRRKASGPAHITDKIYGLRDAVLTGQGGREGWEREFIRDEFDVMLGAAKHLLAMETATASAVIPGSVDYGGSQLDLARPLPISPTDGRLLVDYARDGRTTERSLTIRLLSARLGRPAKSIRSSLEDSGPPSSNMAGQDEEKEKKKEREKAEPPYRSKEPSYLQKFGASMLFDLSLCPPRDVQSRRRRLLTALADSGYAPIKLYYLVQKAQMLTPVPLVKDRFRLIGPKKFKRICDAIRPSE